MPLPDQANRRRVIERVIGSHVHEPIRGAAESREIAFARLAAPLARLARAIATAWAYENDLERYREACASLPYAVESIAGAVLTVIELGESGDVTRLMVRDVQFVEELIARPPRGIPEWHEEPDLRNALRTWTMDLYQDINGGIGRFDARGWQVEVDGELVRAVRDCVDLSAWLEQHRP